MKFMGSKNRIAKEILPIMVAERGDRVWVEPGQPRAVMNITFGNGPKWKSGTKVLCVVRIKTTDGAEGLLKAGKTAVAAAP